MSPRPIDHPLAIAYLTAYAEAHNGPTMPTGGKGGAPMAMHRALGAWQQAGCPLYQEPDTTGDDDAR